MLKITREQFEEYERVRLSGVTNMFDTKKINELSGLDKKQIFQIMTKYRELRKEYGEIKQDK